MSQFYVLAPAEFKSSAPSCDCLAHGTETRPTIPRRERRYPSDMTDAEWAVVRPLLPVPGWLEGRGGQPEGYCHRQMIDAIRYLVDNGIKWRAMPADFPGWDRVYAFFPAGATTAWSRSSTTGCATRIREAAGRDAEPTRGRHRLAVGEGGRERAGIRHAGFDGGKMINGRKRHIWSTRLGLLLGVHGHAAPAPGTGTAARILLRPAARRATPASTGVGRRRLHRAAGRLGPGRAAPRAARSSNAATTPAGSWCCPTGGWWSARSPG